MTTPDQTTPTTGVPAWILTALQATLLITATTVCFHATNHQHTWILAAAAAAAIGWALLRPDSPGAAAWILIMGAWWLTGLATPTLTTTLQAALLVLAGHHLTAVRASNHRNTRLSVGYLAASLSVLAVLMLATALAAPLISHVSNSPITSDQWAIAATSAAVAALAGTTIWLTTAETRRRM